MSSISTVFWPRYWHISISLKTVRFGLKCFDSSRCVEGGGRSRDLVLTSKYNLQFYGYLHNAHNIFHSESRYRCRLWPLNHGPIFKENRYLFRYSVFSYFPWRQEMRNLLKFTVQR